MSGTGDNHLALTDRQRQVLDGLAGGRTQKEVARDLDLSLSAIQSHVRAIQQTLGALTVAHAVDIAHRTGIFDQPAEQPSKPAIRRVWDPPDAIRRRRHELDEALRGYERPQRKAVRHGR